MLFRRGADAPPTVHGHAVSTDGPLLTWVVVSYGGRRRRRTASSTRSAPTPPSTSCCAPTGPVTPRPRQRRSPDDPRVRVLSFEDNPGYLPALHRALPEIDTTRPVVLSNCDLLADPGAVDELLAQVEAFPDAGWLAPSIIGSLGPGPEPQPPASALGPVVARPRRHPPFPAGHRPAAAPQGGAQLARPWAAPKPGSAVFAGHGSCIVLTPRFFAAGGSCDYPFALFGEELWFGRECARLGLTVRYVPSAVLRHAEHAATGRRRRGARGPGEVRGPALVGPAGSGRRVVTAHPCVAPGSHRLPRRLVAMSSRAPHQRRRLARGPPLQRGDRDRRRRPRRPTHLPQHRRRR